MSQTEYDLTNDPEMTNQDARAAALQAALLVLSQSGREFDAVDLIAVAMWIYDGKDPYATARPIPFPDAADWVAEDQP